jgi:hypothetical protein
VIGVRRGLENIHVPELVDQLAGLRRVAHVIDRETSATFFSAAARLVGEHDDVPIEVTGAEPQRVNTFGLIGVGTCWDERDPARLPGLADIDDLDTRACAPLGGTSRCPLREIGMTGAIVDVGDASREIGQLDLVDELHVPSRGRQMIGRITMLGILDLKEPSILRSLVPGVTRTLGGGCCPTQARDQSCRYERGEKLLSQRFLLWWSQSPLDSRWWTAPSNSAPPLYVNV